MKKRSLFLCFLLMISLIGCYGKTENLEEPCYAVIRNSSSNLKAKHPSVSIEYYDKEGNFIREEAEENFIYWMIPYKNQLMLYGGFKDILVFDTDKKTFENRASTGTTTEKIRVFNNYYALLFSMGYSKSHVDENGQNKLDAYDSKVVLYDETGKQIRTFSFMGQKESSMRK